MKTIQTFIVDCNDDQTVERNHYANDAIIPHREVSVDSYGGISNDVITAEVRWLLWDNCPIPVLEAGKQYIVTIQETEAIKSKDV